LITVADKLGADEELLASGIQGRARVASCLLVERDQAHTVSEMITYWIGPRGIEPKLKLKIGHIPGATDEDFLRKSWTE
jgi:hypothetical protein